MRKYGVDKNGFIKSGAGLNEIKAPFKKIVTGSRREIIGKFGGKIHSIYIYGSAATGKARPRISDLDILVAFRKKPTSEIEEQIKDLQNILSNKFRQAVRKVDIVSIFVKEATGDKYGWGCFIKHLSVCVYGTDLSKNLPKFKPSKKIASAFNSDIGKCLDDTLEKLESISDDREVINLCRETMRKIVRAGFSLVMDREESWTSDLDKSCEVFSKYYPEQTLKMKKALAMAKKPLADKKTLADFLNGFRYWLTREANRKL
ncbi:MAG: nucleotidyltransferase domain-containing protein [Parcubacteria group bacterium]|jgi:predicted nucleotidyltransferase